MKPVHRRFRVILIPVFFTFLLSMGAVRAQAQSEDNLSTLSDEFDSPGSLKDWKRVYQTEKTGADQLDQFEIGRAKKGWMTLIPKTSTWYMEYRGVLTYKEVQGDFVVSTRASVSNRAGNGAPRSGFSLGGLMIRTPRNITPRTWQRGGENYIFLSLGAAKNPGRFAFEVKTTQNSRSQLEIEPISSGNAEIRIARVGPHFVLLRKLSGQQEWTVHRRYHRPDMPAKLQVGFTVYTDYATASRMSPRQQNTTVITGGHPDLKASFDYYRLERPNVPRNLSGKRISSASDVSDADLLKFLGSSIDRN